MRGELEGDLAEASGRAAFHIGAHSSCASCSSASARSRFVGNSSGAVRLRSVITCRSASPATSRRSIPMYACVHGESRRVVTPLVRSTMLLLPPLLPPLLPLMPLLRLLFNKTFGRWAARPFGHLKTSTHDIVRGAKRALHSSREKTAGHCKTELAQNMLQSMSNRGTGTRTMLRRQKIKLNSPKILSTHLDFELVFVYALSDGLSATRGGPVFSCIEAR